jgi:hypothetical protein
MQHRILLPPVLLLLAALLCSLGGVLIKSMPCHQSTVLLLDRVERADEWRALFRTVGMEPGRLNLH